MSLAQCLKDDLVRYYEHLAARVDRVVQSVRADQLWIKPYPYGNSIGHLVLHLTGNLNFYIGAGIAKTGYIRNRPLEFTDPSHPPAAKILADFHAAVAMVIRTIRSLDDNQLQAPVTDQPPIQTCFGLLLVCASHMNNHIGQMAYLVQAFGDSTREAPSW